MKKRNVFLQSIREALDKIAAFLIEKETITGKEFMKIFHEVEGIDPDAPKEDRRAYWYENSTGT